MPGLSEEGIVRLEKLRTSVAKSISKAEGRRHSVVKSPSHVRSSMDSIDSRDSSIFEFKEDDVVERVQIRDIFVSQKGEFQSPKTSESRAELLIRMRKHIKFIFDLGMKEHQKENFVVSEQKEEQKQGELEQKQEELEEKQGELEQKQDEPDGPPDNLEHLLGLENLGELMEQIEMAELTELVDLDKLDELDEPGAPGEQKETKEIAVPQFLKGASNHVTRVLTNEFSLYPSKTSGPFTMQEYNLLIAMIEKMATSDFLNFHMYLGTIPVVDEVGVHNVSIYVQTGHPPKITPSTKALPSHLDATYPKETNPYFAALSENTSAVSDFEDKLRRIYQALSEELIKIPLTLVQDAISILRHMPMDIVKKFPTELMPLLEAQILGVARDYLQLDDHEREWLMDSIQKARGVAQDFIEAEFFRQKSFLDTHAEHIPEIVLGDNASPSGGSKGFTFGGQVESTTAGGMKFTAVGDICADHAKAVGKNAYHKRNESRHKSLDSPQSPLVSQFISSDTVVPEGKNLITRRFSQVEPLPAKSGFFESPLSKTPTSEDSSRVITQVHFGKPMTVKVGKPYYLEPDPLKEAEIAAKHQLFIEVEALRRYVVQRPNEKAEVNQELLLSLARLMIEQHPNAAKFRPEARERLMEFIIGNLNIKGPTIDSPNIGEIFLEVQRLEHVQMMFFAEAAANKNEKEALGAWMAREAIRECKNWDEIDPKDRERTLKIIVQGIVRCEQPIPLDEMEFVLSKIREAIESSTYPKNKSKTTFLGRTKLEEKTTYGIALSSAWIVSGQTRLTAEFIKENIEAALAASESTPDSRPSA